MNQNTETLSEMDEWARALEAILVELEDAEMGLSSEGLGRKFSGSYYTPSDVAAHFWRLFWRHHEVTDNASAKAFIGNARLVEPSVGSGMFLFSMMRSLASFGIGPREMALVSFQAIDINQAALDFVQLHITRLESAFSVRFKGVLLEHADFLLWANGRDLGQTVFVGNPPFVSNTKGSRWKNLYADFVEVMVSQQVEPNMSLILPVSICFSRDYVSLRRLLKGTGMPLSASSYDNIPDCLFKAGKPESGNTNKANSQRCTILNLGGSRNGIVESTALLRWTAGQRENFLASTPHFHDCAGFDIERQIPRPSDTELTEYLRGAENGWTIREFMSRIGRGAFAIGGVARNFIGIREYEGKAPGVIPVRTNERDSSLILLQIFASDLFYKYWRSFGDGFHVTHDVIDRFPISKGLMRNCEENLEAAAQVWDNRENFAKTKRNSGKIVKSYDFSSAF